MKLRAILSDRLYQSALGVVLVLLVTLAYLFGAVLDIPLTSHAKTVKVEMTATGGLFEGSAVTYRGVKVGKVRTIRLTEDGIVATLTLTKGSDHIPKDSLVKVRSLSPVGEQYLDFQPRVDHGPYLEDGAVVPASATDLPKTLASTVISVNKLLDQIDERQLHTLLTELSTGLAGTGQDVGRLVDQGDLILADLERYWPQTDRLLTNGGTVLDITADKADQLRVLARSSRQFARFLRTYDPELRRNLEQLPGQLAVLRALVRDAGRLLPGFLGEAVEVSDLFRSYEPHLRELLAQYGPGMGTLGRAVRDGYLHISGIPQRNRRCMYDTPVRKPTDPERRPLVRDGHCPGSFPRYERGAAHAPGPVR